MMSVLAGNQDSKRFYCREKSEVPDAVDCVASIEPG